MASQHPKDRRLCAFAAPGPSRAMPWMAAPAQMQGRGAGKQSKFPGMDAARAKPWSNARRLENFSRENNSSPSRG
jgi:hypothetical protein